MSASDRRSIFLKDKFPKFFERILDDLEDTHLVSILLTRHDTPEEKQAKRKRFAKDYGEFLNERGKKDGLHTCGFYKRLRVNYPDLHQKYSKFRAGRIELDIEDLRARQNKASQQTPATAAKEYVEIFKSLSNELKGVDADAIVRASESVYKTYVNRQIQSMRNELEVLRIQVELNPELNSKIMVEKEKITIQEQTEEHNANKMLDNVELEEVKDKDGKPLSFEEKNKQETLKSVNKITDLAQNRYGWSEDDLSIIKEEVGLIDDEGNTEK